MNKDTENKQELSRILDADILYHIDIIESGDHDGDWIVLTIPGELGGTLKVLPTVERLGRLRKQVKGIFNSTPKRRKATPRARPTAKVLEQFIFDGEHENASEYAKLHNIKL